MSLPFYIFIERNCIIKIIAVVHHGGAGTTQSATLAGKPSVIIAHIGEQEYWGTELRRRGIAGKTLWRRRVTAAALARRAPRCEGRMGWPRRCASSRR